MAPQLSWRQARIVELLGRVPAMTAGVIQAHMLDPISRPPLASIRRDIGVLRTKGYTITSDRQTGLYALVVGRPASDTSRQPVTTPDDVYANV